MFYEEYKVWQQTLKEYSIEEITEGEVLRVLNKDRLDPYDLLTLLSPAAESYLEEMAQKANKLTLQYFGRNISLFTPLYLANFCSNQCVYCSFNTKNKINRRKLTLEEAEKEGRAIAETGLQHLLLLTGESRQASSPQYIQQCVTKLRPHFASLGIEVYPLEEEEYHELYLAGIDSLTMFQEVYNEELYAKVHPAGPKSNYQYRLDAPERACRAGIPSVTIGALLGLGDWRTEAFFTAQHIHYLQNNYPDVEYALSIPRMRPHVGGYQPEHPVTDAELVQIILAYRLYLPRAGIILSTRESSALREALLPLGITKISAGSLTTVGGYADDTEASGQFEIADERSVEEIVLMLKRKGFQPVFCDWLNLRERGTA